MGTSMARKAPTGKFWRAAKAAASRFSSPHNTGHFGVSEVVSRYIAALRETTFPASTGSLAAIRQVAENLGAFHSRVAKVGVERALEEHGLNNLISRPPEEMIAGWVDMLAGPGALLEEAVARSTLVDGVVKNFQASGVSWHRYLQEISSVTAITSTIRDYLATALFHKLCSDLGESLEAQAQDAATGLRHRQNIGLFIQQRRRQLDEGDSLDIDWSQADRQTWISRQLATLMACLVSSHVK